MESLIFWFLIMLVLELDGVHFPLWFIVLPFWLLPACKIVVNVILYLSSLFETEKK